MAKGRKLKKVIGDLEAQKQNVISSKLIIREQWDPFQYKLGILIENCWVRLFSNLHTLIKWKKKIVQKYLNLIIPAPSVIWRKVWDFFFQNFFIAILEKGLNLS